MGLATRYKDLRAGVDDPSGEVTAARTHDERLIAIDSKNWWWRAPLALLALAVFTAVAVWQTSRGYFWTVPIAVATVLGGIARRRWARKPESDPRSDPR